MKIKNTFFFFFIYIYTSTWLAGQFHTPCTSLHESVTHYGIGNNLDVRLSITFSIAQKQASDHKKFVSAVFSFDKFWGYNWFHWRFLLLKMIDDLQEKDRKLGEISKKSLKVTCLTVHPGNNTQNVNVALAIFYETTAAVILNWIPEISDAASKDRSRRPLMRDQLKWHSLKKGIKPF